jgi:hypothetical protein
MIIARKVNHCDFTDRSYAAPVDGVAFIAQGATGRWCEVMWCGPEEAAAKGYDKAVISYEEAVAKAETTGYVDF